MAWDIGQFETPIAGMQKGEVVDFFICFIYFFACFF